MRKYLTLVLTFGALGLPGRAGADDWTSLLKDDLRHWQSAGGGDSLRAEKGTLTVSAPASRSPAAKASRSPTTRRPRSS
jgi:hypothetical protein